MSFILAYLDWVHKMTPHLRRSRLFDFILWDALHALPGGRAVTSPFGRPSSRNLEDNRTPERSQ